MVTTLTINIKSRL